MPVAMSALGSAPGNGAPVEESPHGPSWERLPMGELIGPVGEPGWSGVIGAAGS